MSIFHLGDGYPVLRQSRQGSSVLMRCLGVLVLVAALGVHAGCGGDSGAGDAEERRAALDRWLVETDATCRKGNRAIAARGWPANLVDLDRLTVRAVEDVQETTEAIRKLPPPKGSEGRIKPFLASLEALEPVMDELSSTTEDFKTGALENFAPRLQTALRDVGETSEELGLSECGSHDEHRWMADAIRAPVFAQQLADLEGRITKRAKAISKPAATRAAAVRNLDRLSDLLVTADKGLSRLKPPAWAQEEAATYVDRLRDVSAALDTAATELDEPTLTPAEANAAGRRIDATAERADKAYKRLAKDLGAAPTAPGGGGGDEGESPAGDENQAA